MTLTERHTQLTERLAQYQQQHTQLTAAIEQLRGALAILNELLQEQTTSETTPAAE